MKIIRHEFNQGMSLKLTTNGGVFKIHHGDLVMLILAKMFWLRININLGMRKTL